MPPIFFDTETIGLHGPAALIQYAVGDGEIVLHEVFKTPAADTLRLIESFANNADGVVGFNLAFDWFHLCQLYTTLELVADDSLPPDIEEYALLEAEARLGVCVKPVTACDLMLHARKGPYQSVMERHPIRIKRIPTKLAYPLAAELKKRVQLDNIYFARYKETRDNYWSVQDIVRSDGTVDPDFKNIVMRFAASGGLKAIAEHALNLPDNYKIDYSTIELPKELSPKEYGYAPFATAVGSPDNWNHAWPEVAKYHIEHWHSNSLAREYAYKDVVYTRDLYKYFGCPELGDNDSILACMVGAVRWRGFAIDKEKIEAQRAKMVEASKMVKVAPLEVKRMLQEVMSPVEQLALTSTSKQALTAISAWTSDEEEENEPEPDIQTLEAVGRWGAEHPAAKIAKKVLAARSAIKEIELYDKLLLAGRFHASFKVIGALSGRMSGGDGLNPQGINRSSDVRSCFPLADCGLVLDGGDFDSFEVSIAEAEYNDPNLREALLSKRTCSSCCGIGCKDCNGTGTESVKMHGLFGQDLFDEDYDTVIHNKDHYTKGKSGVFAMIYGGVAQTLERKLGVSIEIAERAFAKFKLRFPGVERAQSRIKDMFCSMKQSGGIGSKIEWNEPAEYVESMLGFRRYFTLENRIAKALFELAEKPPKEWLKLTFKVTRRDREQTAGNAVRSAVFAAAFAIQAANLRAATNHRIQSTGSGITKDVQCAIWDFQPSGVNEWRVVPLNIHDEIQCPRLPELRDALKQVVDNKVESYRPLIPLIGMQWKRDMQSWAEK